MMKARFSAGEGGLSAPQARQLRAGSAGIEARCGKKGL
jgi:hypothetical protein